jgi:cytochrome c oxidase subunit IV
MNQESKTHIGHISPIKVYILVGITLFILTGVTVKVSTIQLGAWNAIAALAIATVKALLVALFFMHLLYDRKIYAMVVSTAVVMLGIFIALTMADVLRRGDIDESWARPINPQAQIYSRQKSDTTSARSDTIPTDTVETRK